MVLTRVLEAVFKLAVAHGEFRCDVISAGRCVDPTRGMILDRLADLELALEAAQSTPCRS
jgi:hypothetical protein